MEWISKTSSFKYNGEPVTRKKVISPTIFGYFEVFETVGGNCFLRHPFLKSNYINKWPFSSIGYDNGLEEWFGKSKAKCKSLEEGITICEQVMAKVKTLVNSY